MEKILERIIETDRAARDKVSVQKQRLEMINDEIAAEKAHIDEKLQQSANEAIEKTKEETGAKVKSEISRIDAYFNETEAALNKSYDENRDKWIEEIFSAVIK